MTASVWYRLLNCGFGCRPPQAPTRWLTTLPSVDRLALTRVYASVPRHAAGTAPWFDSLKHGHTFATNGPLLGLTLGGKAVGEELKLPAGENKVMFTSSASFFRSSRPLRSGLQRARAARLEADSDRQTADVKGTIAISQTGWCVLRASTTSRSIRCLTTMSTPRRARFTSA